MPKFNKIKYTEENWLDERKKGIGGSDAGAIFGFNKYKSVLEVWLEKTGQYNKKVDNTYIRHGHKLEPIVVSDFEDETGLKVRNNNFLLQSKEYPFILANIDREGVDEEGNKFVLECKTAAAYSTKDWKDDEIPPSYEFQVQHYLLVTGYKYGYIAVLIGGNDFRYKRVDADPELHKIMIKKYQEFWEMVENNIKPNVSSIDADLLQDFYPQSNEKSIDLLPSFDDKLKRIQEIKIIEKELKEEKSLLENQVKEYMEDNEVAENNNYKVSWKTTTTNRFDTTKLKKENKELYEQYLNQSQTRRFTIKELKND